MHGTPSARRTGPPSEACGAGPLSRWTDVSFRRVRDRRRPGRPDRGLSAHQAGHLDHGHRSRSALRRRHQPHRQLQELPVRHRRPPLLLQVEGGGGPLERDPARRLHQPPAHVAHLLQRQLLLLSAEGLRGAHQPRPRRERHVRALLHVQAGLPQREARHLPRVGGQSVRRAAVLDLLQDLHREGVGHELRRDLGRLGRPAHQGPRPVDGHVARAPRLAVAGQEGARHQGQRRGHQDPDRQLPVSAPRPRHDVGRSRPQGARAGRRDPHGHHAGEPALGRATTSYGRSTARNELGRDELLHGAVTSSPRPRSASCWPAFRRSRDARPPPTSCAIATSSRSP